MRVVRVLVLWLVPSLAAAQVVQPVQILHAFRSSPASPSGGLVALPDGSLYGVTADAIYRVAPGTGAVTIAARFTDGWGAGGTLARGGDGALYGTTRYGGSGARGTVFRFDPSTGQLRTLHAFDGASVQSFPVGGVAIADGFLYAVTNFGFARTDPATRVTETLLDQATPQPPDVPGPLTSPLTVGADGLLYGTSQLGPSADGGSLYRFDPQTRVLRVVHRFDTARTHSPVGRLLLTGDGLLIGASRGDPGVGGSVWRFNPSDGSLVVLKAFDGGDAARPGPLMLAADGSLFGTTDHAGATADAPDVAVAIFRLRPSPGPYLFEIVRSFDPATTGSGVDVELTEGTDGRIYGYAQSDGPEHAGSVYRFDPASSPLVFEVLHTFPQTTTWMPSVPGAASGGFLYGTTTFGGANQRGGVYRVNAATGQVDIVADLPGPRVSGFSANSSLALGANGDLYATGSALASPTATTADHRIVRVTSTNFAVTVPIQSTVAGGPGIDVDTTPVNGADGALYFQRGVVVMRYDPGAGTLAVAGTPPSPPNLAFNQVTPLLAAADGRIYVGVATSVLVQNGRFPNLVTTVRLMRVATASTALEDVVDVSAGALSALGLVQTPDGTMYLGSYDGAIAIDPVARTFKTACSLNARPGGYWTATDDNRLVTVILPAENSRFQRMAVCSPATGAVVDKALPPGIGTIDRPLVASGGFLYGATIDFGFQSTFSPVPSLRQPGGALIRLSLAATLPAIDTDGDGLPNTFETTYGLDPDDASGVNGAAGDADGDGRTNAQELAEGTDPHGVLTRYFAEGASNPFFRTRFDFANPNTGQAALVQLRFLTDAGVKVTQDIAVPQSGHVSFDPATLPALSFASYSTVVESDVTIAVDRTMTWDASGYGSHQETGIVAPSTTWYFAEGSTSGNFALFYLLQNPHATTVTATVRYLRPGGPAAVEKTYTLPPASRTTIAVDAEGPDLANTDVSAVITASAPIVAERAMYFSKGAQPFTAGHESAGVTAPALQWFLAEGATGPFFDLFVLLANPNPTAATVEIEYLTVEGATLTKTYTVPGNSRVTVWVDDEQLPAGSGQRPLANVAVSMSVRSTNGVPIVVERSMWWPGPETTADFWYEAHNSPGTTTTATRWLVAGGQVDAATAATTYLLIANPTPSPAIVLVRRLYDDGHLETWTAVALPAKSRRTIPFTADDYPAGSYGFGIQVESIGPDPVPIVVEHATYASPGGLTWSSGSNAVAAPLP